MRQTLELVILFLCLIRCKSSTSWKWQQSSVDIVFGHYPPSYLTFTNIYLNGSDGVFHYNSPKNLLTNVFGTHDVWQFAADNCATQDDIQCTEIFDEGYAFTIFYYGGGSNYYHMHYDVMMPLFNSIYRGKSDKTDIKMAFMPTVETSRLKKLDWNTLAFSSQHRNPYWNEMTLVMVGHHSYRPLDQKIRSSKSVLCFNKLFVGTIATSHENAEFVADFREMVYKHLNLPVPQRVSVARIGVIGRSGRRRVLNEAELVAALQSVAPTDLLLFDKMSYKEQVQAMASYAVVIGMHGAGLMNCLYLPANSVCIQLVPLRTHGHHTDFGRLLQARGPYLEWRNSHEHLHHHVAGDDYHNIPDTTVPLDELTQLARQALDMAGVSVRVEL